MFEALYPDKYLKSTYDINFEQLYERGFRGILFDIDNTLVPHGAPADARAIQLFERLHGMGFETCLISNNREPKGYLEGIRRMGTKTDNTFFVGDQIFTDVLGAKRAGLYTIMVSPVQPKEEIQIVLKRYLEKIVLHFYFRTLKKKRVEK